MLSSVTGLYPWLGYRATDRITVWGVTGYGVGGMLLTPGGGPALESGLSTAMAAAGTRGELVGGGGNGFAARVQGRRPVGGAPASTASTAPRAGSWRRRRR